MIGLGGLLALIALLCSLVETNAADVSLLVESSGGGSTSSSGASLKSVLEDDIQLLFKWPGDSLIHLENVFLLFNSFKIKILF